MDAQRAFVAAIGKSVAGWKLAIRPDGTAIAAPMVDCYSVTDDNLATFPAKGSKGLRWRSVSRSHPIFPHQATPH